MFDLPCLCLCFLQGFWVALFVSTAMGVLIAFAVSLCATYNSPLATVVTGNVKDVGAYFSRSRRDVCVHAVPCGVTACVYTCAYGSRCAYKYLCVCVFVFLLLHLGVCVRVCVYGRTVGTLLGWALFGDFVATANAVLGLLLSFFGAALYSFGKLQQATKQQQSKADKPEGAEAVALVAVGKDGASV